MLFSWGANSHGQLGLNSTSEQETKPRLVANTQGHEDEDDNKAWKFVTGGGGHTLAVEAAGGRVFACGWNLAGQLGLGHREPAICRLVAVPGLTSPAEACAAGWDFSLVLTGDGRVWASGSNTFGQLGRRPEELKASASFVVVPGLEDIVHVSAGLRHAAAVDKDGHVFTWGLGSKGQLGIEVDRKSDQIRMPQKLPAIDNVASVSCGQNFTILLLRNRRLVGFGDNKFGQISCEAESSKIFYQPQNIPLKDVRSLSCGWTHTCCLTTCGEVVAWGRNNYHQCSGTGDRPLRTVALSTAAGNDSLPDGEPAAVVKVLAGSEHCLALDTAGRVFAWGWNEHGNCGLGHEDNVVEPTRIVFDSDTGATEGGKVTNIFVGSGHCFAIA